MVILCRDSQELDELNQEHSQVEDLGQSPRMPTFNGSGWVVELVKC